MMILHLGAHQIDLTGNKSLYRDIYIICKSQDYNNFTSCVFLRCYFFVLEQFFYECQICVQSGTF